MAELPAGADQEAVMIVPDKAEVGEAVKLYVAAALIVKSRLLESVLPGFAQVIFAVPA